MARKLLFGSSKGNDQMNWKTTFDNPPQRTTSDMLEWRTRFSTELDSLVAVLEIAIAKLARGLRVPNDERIRVARIRDDLRRTLATCEQAKLALELAMSAAPATQPGLEVLSKTARPLEYRSLSLSGYDRVCRDYFLRTERRFLSVIPGASKISSWATSA